MNTKYGKSSRWFNLSTLLIAIIAGAISISAQQIVTDNKVESNEVNNSSDLKGGKTPNSSKTAPAPASSVYDWSGFYIGGHIGYGSGKADTDFNPLPSAATFINLAPTTLKVSPKGVNGGVQAGYNWQFGHVVVGAETDFSWSDMKKTTTVTPITQNNGTPFPGAGFLLASQKTKWFGTLRPRLGAAFGKVLIYGTGGLAYGRVTSSANTDFRPFGTTQYPATVSKTATGWTVGGGVEIGINKHFSIKSEYLYYDLGKQTIAGNPSPALPPFQVGYTWETKAHTWNAGFNYRW